MRLNLLALLLILFEVMKFLRFLVEVRVVFLQLYDTAPLLGK